MLRWRSRGNRRYVHREAERRIRLLRLIGRNVRDDKTFSRARKWPLQQSSEHGVPVRNVYGVVRSATTPRERPEDVAETEEAPVDGARFAKARVARSRLRRARPICPFRSSEVDERERAREPILAVVAVQLHAH